MICGLARGLFTPYISCTGYRLGPDAGQSEGIDLCRGEDQFQPVISSERCASVGHTSPDKWMSGAGLPIGTHLAPQLLKSGNERQLTIAERCLKP